MLRQETITLWLFNIAMENGPFIDDFPIKTPIYKGFSMAMLNNQMVIMHIGQMIDSRSTMDGLNFLISYQSMDLQENRHHRHHGLDCIQPKGSCNFFPYPLVN